MFKWSILFVTNFFVLPESFLHYVLIFRITLKKYPEVSVHIKEYCEVRITKDTGGFFQLILITDSIPGKKKF